MPKSDHTKPGPERRSIILSAIVIAGITAFLAGTGLTIFGVFFNQATVGSFSGRFMGMTVTTTNAGLGLAFMGALFAALARLLLPAAAVLFYEQDRRTWIERTPTWFGLAFLLLAFVCLLALITGVLA
jgi:hypothetical protein